MPTTYTRPSVVIQAQGAQTLVSAGARQPAVLVLGTAPQGPDVPIVLDPTNAPSIYGNAASSASLGYTLPLMMHLLRSQSPPTGNASPMQFIVCRAGVTRARALVAEAPATDQVWTLTFTGTVTGGTFTLTYDGVTTAPITYSATPSVTAAHIQTALDALSTIGAGNTTVAATDATHFTITAAAGLADQLLANFTADGASLTGTLPVLTPTITTPGATGATSFTVQAIGPYAGTAGNALYLQVETGTGGVVSKITLWDSGGVPPSAGRPAGTWEAVQVFDSALGIYDLSTPQAIVNTLNGANNTALPTSVMQTNVATNATLPLANLYPFSGGLDGLGTSTSDSSLETLLSASLAYQVDYIVAGFDANQLESTISAHLADAFAQNQFRKAVLGPKQGTTYSTLVTQVGDSSTWYNNFQSSRIICVGHDSVMLPNPITGTTGIYDGFYLAAAVCGLKVSSPVYETCIGFAVSGVVGIPLPPDLNITNPLSSTQRDALAAAGFLVLEPEGGAYVIRDALTTARFIINNTINPFSQWNVQAIDDAVSQVLLAAVLPFKGQAMPDLTTANTMLQSACTGAMASLGQTINGLKNITVTTDPTTLVPTIDIVYVTRFPFRTIEIRTSYTFV